VQRLRARISAIMTGLGTVLSDDPSLNVRLKGEDNLRQPLRIVLDPHLSTPDTARLLSLPGEVLIVTATDEPEYRERLEAQGAEVLYLPHGSDAIDLAALMGELAQRELNEVLLETGATLSGALLQAGLIDELIVYMAPKLMGSGARALFNTPGLEAMADTVALDIQDIRAVGDDWRIRATVCEPAE
jgi:diaminohydroxyphosphoribosylaminopyrimidine deaminase/5-amino-6-(5-phosphoribosylamino)uracil reductase